MRWRSSDYAEQVQIHQIRYFLAVVNHRGINAAAAEIGVAQPTVSQAMHELERDLGTQLFHRLGRGMTLTSAGHALVGPARRILRDVGAAEGSLVDSTGNVRGRLDVGTLPSLAADPVARMVSGFREAHSKVFVRIGDVSSAEAVPSLIEQGNYEIIVTYIPVAGATSGLRVRKVGVQEYCLVFPPGTALFSEDPLRLAELPDIPLIVVRRGSPQAIEIEEAISEVGGLRRPAALVENPQARLPFVLAGVGASFLPRVVAEHAIGRGLVIRATNPPIRWAYGLVYDENALSRAGRAFIDLVFSAGWGDGCNSEEGPACR